MTDQRPDPLTGAGPAPLGTGRREPTDVDAVAERWFARAMELDPAQATVHGFPGHETEYRDFGPEGAGHVRLNFATSAAVLTEAVQRMGTAVRALG